MIRFENTGLLNRLIAEQELTISIDEAWNFLSNPQNLKVITPPEMGFVVNTTTDIGLMYPGQIIEYTVSPLLGIKTSWVTEITYVKHQEYFVDEQRFGPYQLWHHKHFLETTPNGVKMRDIIDYKVPFGILGKILNKLIIEKKLRHIFKYREQKLIDLFSKSAK